MSEKDWPTPWLLDFLRSVGKPALAIRLYIHLLVHVVYCVQPGDDPLLDHDIHPWALPDTPFDSYTRGQDVIARVFTCLVGVALADQWYWWLTRDVSYTTAMPPVMQFVVYSVFWLNVGLLVGDPLFAVLQSIGARHGGALQISGSCPFASRLPPGR